MKNTPTKFLLVAPEKEGVDEFLKEIEVEEIGKVERARNLDLAKVQISSGEVHCVIFNVKAFSLKEVKTIELFCQLNSNISIIAVARIVDELAYNMVKDLRHVVLVQRPLEEAKVIATFCKKMLSKKEAFRREHWRYPTKQGASIEILESHKVHWGAIANISRGGALFEADHDLGLREKDLVKLSVLLDKLPKIHVMTAEVAWSSGFNTDQQKMSIGLKFVNLGELQESLFIKLKG